MALWMRSAGRGGSEEEVEDFDEDEEEAELVVLRVRLCGPRRPLLRPLRGGWRACPRAPVLGGGWLGGRGGALAARQADPVGSGWQERCGLRYPPSGLGWAGLLQCLRACGLVSAGGISSRGLHSVAVGVWLGVSGVCEGVCVGYWAGGRCRWVGGFLAAVCAGHQCGGSRRVSGGRVCGGHGWLIWRLGEARVAGSGVARDARRVWAAGWGVVRNPQGRALLEVMWCWVRVCCVAVCFRLQERACVVTCRPGG